MVVCLLAGTLSVAGADEGAATVDPEGKFLEQLANNGIPAAYGEILSALQAKGSATFTTAATEYVKSGAGGKTLTGLAAATSTRNALSDMNQMFGRLFSGIDVTVKLGSGDTAAAAEASAVWFVTEMAGTEAGKKLLSGYGVTPPVVSALLVSYSVWRESEKALAAETKGARLESLYGTIENMTRSRGRTLGAGDPFPPTRENVDKVWRRILTDPAFREIFNIYVSEMLGKELPSAGFFDWTASHVGGDSTEDVTQAKLREEEQQVKQYVVGLVNWLNRAAKVEEQRVLTYQQLKAIALKIQLNGSSVEQAMVKVDNALVQLGVVASYLNSSQQDIRTATEKDDYETLQAHLKTITDYIQNVIAWLPAIGPLAEVRAEYLAALKDRYKLALTGFNAFRAKLQKRIETPAVPTVPITQGDTGGREAAEKPQPAPIDPSAFYKQYLAKVIKPFDWGGAGAPDSVKDAYERLLAKGDFKQAILLEKGWQNQNFTIVMGGMEGVASLPAPEENETFRGYEKSLAAKIAAVVEPGEIKTLRQSLQSQGAAIEKVWLDGNCMIFPTSFRCGDRPKPPADETREQAKARSDRGQALQEEANAMSAALKPAWMQLEQMSTAWAKAREMAGVVIADRVAMARVSHSELAVWMQATRSVYESRARQASDALQNFRTAVGSITLPPLTGGTAGESALDEAGRLLSDKSYVGIGKFSAPEGGLFSGAERLASERSSRLLNEAKELASQAGWLLSVASREADTFAQGVLLFQEAVATVTPEIDDIVTYVAPGFRDEVATLSRRSEKANVLAKKISSGAEAAERRVNQEIGNREADGFWLRTVANVIPKFRETAMKWGLLESYDDVTLKLPAAETMITPNALRLTYPYYHYLTTAERNAAASLLQGIWNEGGLAAFAAGPAPWLGEKVKPYLDEVARAPSTPEANFCVGDSETSFTVMPVTAGNLARAKQLLATMAPGTQAFEEGFPTLTRLVPMEISGNTGTFRDVYLGAWQHTTLGKQYLDFRNLLKKQYASHLQLWPENQRKVRESAARQALQQMDGRLAALQKRISTGDALIGRAGTAAAHDRAGIEATLSELAMFHDRLLDEPYRQTADSVALITSELGPGEPRLTAANDIVQQIGQLSSRLHIARNRLEALLKQGPQADLAAFYEKFRHAYETRDDSAVMAMIGDDWEAGDGTSLADLQGYLRNSFTVFDQITYTISRLNQTWNGTTCTVSYDVTITGRNFRHKLKHEEKSSVSEEVSLDRNGKPRITRTLNGRFWYVQ